MRSLRYLTGPLASILLFSSTAARADYPTCITGTSTPALLTTWRAAAVADLKVEGHGTTDSVTGITLVGANIRSCYPTTVPSCLSRTLNYAVRRDDANYTSDPDITQTPQKQPPPELLAPNAQGLQYIIPTNLEALAAANGWPSVRYKSRHSGGFDPKTSSLLMVYVPGDKVNPPVTYDRWLNFALPQDVEPNILTPLPQQNFPAVADYATESKDAFDAVNSDDDNNNAGSGSTAGIVYPSTFTMISLERATASSPSHVYFQKFNRGTAQSAIYTPEANPSLSDCITCHPNGMRWISPLGFHVRAGEAQLPPNVWNSVLAINTAMDNASAGKLTDWRSGTRKLLPHSAPPPPQAPSSHHGPNHPPSVTGLTLPTPGAAPAANATPSTASASGSAALALAGSPVTPTAPQPTIPAPLVHPGYFWPVYGQVKPQNKISRTQAYIMGGTLPDGTTTPGCFQLRKHIELTDIFGRPAGDKNVYDLSATPQINWVNVRNAMNCELCHNNRIRYALDERSDEGTIAYKILVDQSMPQGVHQDPITLGDPNATPTDKLTPDERIALANCLKAEADLERPLLDAWLTQQTCQ